MATDIKLDQNGGNWVVVEGTVLKTTAADLMLDSPARRGGGPSPFRRALVHDFQDGLTINFGGDYPGGVTVTGTLTVTGDVKVAGKALNATLAALQSAVEALQRSSGGLEPRLDTLERTVEGLVQLSGAAVIPPWRTRTEVEEGDDMGMAVRSAADLGLVVEYQIDQRNPDFDHGDVISIMPPAGTLVLRGSTVVVRINLEG
jgi:hypothetical protein